MTQVWTGPIAEAHALVSILLRMQIEAQALTNDALKECSVFVEEKDAGDVRELLAIAATVHAATRGGAA